MRFLVKHVDEAGHRHRLVVLARNVWQALDMADRLFGPPWSQSARPWPKGLP